MDRVSQRLVKVSNRHVIIFSQFEGGRLARIRMARQDKCNAMVTCTMVTQRVNRVRIISRQTRP